ncbi:MAG: orotidine 5'-phosphate decarboxylase, partial [Alphaproteobacteria bacterium]|nr:orotidine 5'-phosphate decarboxylase [Alphaproteobacteria bacterium]
MRTTPANPLFCAIDTPDIGRAEALVGAVRDSAGGIKIGKEFFVAHGPDGVRRLTGVGPGSAGGFAEASGLPLFLDLKFHDIPNTVAGAVRSACALAPFMLNVHATGGPAMLRAAAEAAAASEARPLLIGVTVLTSLDDDDLAAVGIAGPVDERAVALARLSQQCGLDGVVCSAAEIEPIRQACGDDFK